MNIINPLVFKHQICPNCKSINHLVFVDQYNRKTSNPIYPATELICEKCQTKFPIYWKPVDEVMTPYPGKKDKEKEAIDEIIKFSLQNVRKLD